MYQLILVFTKNSVNGACMHSQTVGLYESKAEAEEAAKSMEFRDREFTVSKLHRFCLLRSTPILRVMKISIISVLVIFTL